MENLIQSQQSEGCWTDFSVIQSYVTYECYSAFNSFLSKNSDIKDIVTTVLALQFLEQQFSDQKEEWDMIQSKAKKWLKKQGIDAYR